LLQSLSSAPKYSLTLKEESFPSQNNQSWKKTRLKEKKKSLANSPALKAPDSGQ